MIVAIAGGYVYHTTIGVMGGRYLVSFNAETRTHTGRAAGDEIEVELMVDPDRSRSALLIPPVRKAGLEPARLSAQEPKSCVSANFTTPASAFSV